MPSTQWFRLSLFAAASMMVFEAHAFSAKDAAQQAILRNPEVQARWHAFKEATEEIDVAKGAYLPKVNASAGIYRERVDEPNQPSNRFTRKGVALYLDQMLFDGFATRSEVKRLSYAQRTRYYELLDVSETIALETVRAYNDVLRYRKLYKLSQDNYIQHRMVYEQIQKRVEAGVGRRVDMEQAGGRLALSESNLTTEAANLHDVSRRYQRIVGELPPADMDEPPQMDAGIPAGKRDVILTAYQQHPALAASMENIVSAQAGAEGVRSKYMPRLDLRAKKELGWDVDGVDGRTMTDSIGLVLNYNLYNGGSDKASERQYWERVNIAKDLRDKTCRDIRQTVTIAHNDINRLNEQLRYLDIHQLSTEKVMEAYRRQFDIGQRSLLDLLDTENELFQARRAYINAVYDNSSAYGRTQAGMGNLLATLQLQRLDAPAPGGERPEFDPTTICPPDDADQVTVDKDQIYADWLAANPPMQPLAPAPAKAAPAKPAPAPLAAPAAPMSELDKAKPGDVVILKGVAFEFDSAKLRPESLPILDEAVATLVKRAELKALVAGHTCNIGDDAYNQRLSERRAASVMHYLVSKGVAADRLTSKGYGESQPIADNKTAAGRTKNRRVELKIPE